MKKTKRENLIVLMVRTNRGFGWFRAADGSGENGYRFCSLCRERIAVSGIVGHGEALARAINDAIDTALYVHLDEDCQNFEEGSW